MKEEIEEIKKERNGEMMAFPWMGIILLLIAILGFCSFGRVSLLIKLVCVTLVGGWYNLLLLGIAIYGIFLIVQHQPIHFLKEKYMWIYIILFCLLLLSHIDILENMTNIDTKNFKFVEDTQFVVENYVDNILSLWEIGNPNLTSNLGGGVLAALCSSILVSFLTDTWAIVALILIILFGIWTFIRVPIKKKFKKVENEEEETSVELTEDKEQEEELQTEEQEEQKEEEE